MIELEEIERDAIVEIANRGIGTAAAALSEMVREEIELNLPSVEFLTPEEVAHRISPDCEQRMAAVAEAFDGPFAGESLILFTETKGLDLVASILEQGQPSTRLTELEEEALTEIGNVVLNGCLSGIANALGEEITVAIPRILHGSSRQIFSAAAPESDKLVLLLNIKFCIRSRDVEGYITFILGIHAAQRFKELVAAYIKTLMA